MANELEDLKAENELLKEQLANAGKPAKPGKPLTADQLADKAFDSNAHVGKVWVDVKNQTHYLTDMTKTKTGLKLVERDEKEWLTAQDEANKEWKAGKQDRIEGKKKRD